MRESIARSQLIVLLCRSNSIARVKSMLTTGKFAGDRFFAALDGVRISKELNWKKVAEQAKVPASTLTRISQGRKPDVDTLAALCVWSGLRAEIFMAGAQTRSEPLAEMTALFRADPNLTNEGARALEAIIKTAYEQLRKL
jgi:transcriptional regulator with XRE-family HTH domain